MDTIRQTANAILSPHTVAFLCKLTAVCAIVSFSTIGFSTGFMLNAYIFASRAWVPDRSHYDRPLFFLYNSTAATAQVSFVEWHQTAEGYHIAPERVEFLQSRDTVNIHVELSLPESDENTGLFQLCATLRSDAGAALHSMHRPLVLPHRSRVVATLRQLTLFPLYLTGFLSESTTLRYAVAESFIERPAAPLAAVEVVVTGGRPQHAPPVIYEGTVTVDVQMSWTQRLLSIVRVSPLLHLGVSLGATALMFLSSAAAICSCVLSFQIVASFYADTGHAAAAASTQGGSTGVGGSSPLKHDVAEQHTAARVAALPTAEVLQQGGAPSRGGSSGGGDGAEADSGNGGEGHSAWFASSGRTTGDGCEGGEHRRRSFASGSNRSHQGGWRCNSPSFKSQVKAAVEKGSAEFRASHHSHPEEGAHQGTRSSSLSREGSGDPQRHVNSVTADACRGGSEGGGDEGAEGRSSREEALRRRGHGQSGAAAADGEMWGRGRGCESGEIQRLERNES